MTGNPRRVSAVHPLNLIPAVVFPLLLGLSWPAFCQAQPGRSPRLGLTVQLPTLRTFSVQTAVRVPDGGTMTLGGNAGQASGRISSGVPGLPGRPFGQSSIGRSTRSGGVSVRTRIIDQRELERRLLGEDQVQPPGSRPATTAEASDPVAGDRPTAPIVQVPEAIDAFADYLSQHVARRGP